MKVGQIVAPRQIEIVDIEQPNLADHPDGTVMIKTAPQCHLWNRYAIVRP